MKEDDKFVVDENLLAYGSPTERQREIFAAVKAAEGNVAAAARTLGLHHKTVHEHMNKLASKAAMQGHSPLEDAAGMAPEGYVTRGKSILYDRKGKITQKWVKTNLSQQAYIAAIKQALRDELHDVDKIPVGPAPVDFQDDIIPWIQIGDAHLGMLAHVAETNDNFDLKIAERELLAAIFQLIDDLPMCGRIVINDLGDFTHYENMSGTTEASGHPLDYDGRFPKMIRAYRRIMVAIVQRALTRAAHVDVIINQGNHSRTNDFWMAECLRGMFEHSERVHVLDNDSVFISYRMGKTLVMVHHSDKCPPARLIGVMTTDFREDFGETEFHYIDMGHVHHHFVSKEYPGVVLESWNHLAPNDKWAHDAGYRSRKAISVVFRSKTHGELGRRLLPLEEVRARIEATTGIKSVNRKKVHTV